MTKDIMVEEQKTRENIWREYHGINSGGENT
jgi:hypothetical protein